MTTGFISELGKALVPGPEGNFVANRRNTFRDYTKYVLQIVHCFVLP